MSYSEIDWLFRSKEWFDADGVCYSLGGLTKAMNPLLCKDGTRKAFVMVRNGKFAIAPAPKKPLRGQLPDNCKKFSRKFSDSFSLSEAISLGKIIDKLSQGGQ